MNIIKSPRCQTISRTRSSGFMLMEVLVSILIFSVGVLALIGLQARLSKAQGASKLRTDAAYMAQEVIGLMWADIASPTNATNYTTNCANYGPCSDWVQKVSASLPSGTGRVTFDAGQNMYTITITWQASAEGHSYITTTSTSIVGCRDMSTPRTPPKSRSMGFTLIELMVAMMLGLITTVIIAEVLLKSEGNKRATTNGGDAQVSGALSLYTLERDIKMAGYGVAAKASALGCAITAKRGGTTTTATLAPVVITSGGGQDQSDTITVLSSAKSSFAVPMDLSSDHLSSSSAFAVKSALGVAVGDFMLAIPKTPTASKGCTMFQVTAVDATVGSITHAATSLWNQTLATFIPTYVSDDDSLVNLGSVRLRTYSLDNTNNTLQVQDMDMSTGTMSAAQAIYTNVVLVKAMYGRDTDADGSIDTYDDNISTAAEWATVRAVRIAVVARSEQREKVAITEDGAPSLKWDVGVSATVAPTNSTVTCEPTTDPTRCTLTLKVPTTSASSTDTDEWKHYRYKVYDTVVPVRNMLWSS